MEKVTWETGRFEFLPTSMSTVVDISVIIYSDKVLQELRCSRCDRLLAKHLKGKVQIKCPRCGLLHDVKPA